MKVTVFLATRLVTDSLVTTVQNIWSTNSRCRIRSAYHQPLLDLSESLTSTGNNAEWNGMAGASQRVRHLSARATFEINEAHAIRKTVFSPPTEFGVVRRLGDA